MLLFLHFIMCHLPELPMDTKLDGYCVQGSSRKEPIHSFWQVLGSIVLYAHTWCLQLTQICSFHWSNKQKRGMSFPKFCFSNLPKFTWTNDVTTKVSHDTFQEWIWYTGHLTSPTPQSQVGVKNHSLQLPWRVLHALCHWLEPWETVGMLNSVG